MSLHLIGLYFKWLEICRRAYKGYWNEFTDCTRENIRTNFFMAGTKILFDNEYSINNTLLAIRHYFVGVFLSIFHIIFGLLIPFIAVPLSIVEYIQDCRTKHVDIIYG